MPRLLRALRGAIAITEDTPGEVASQVEALLRESFTRNGIALDDLVSILFTATDDIRSAFPAQAARERLGLDDVPLLCARELDIEGAMPGVIRVLVHFYTDRARHEIEHVYLGSAIELRPDLPHRPGEPDRPGEPGEPDGPGEPDPRGLRPDRPARPDRTDLDV